MKSGVSLVHSLKGLYTKIEQDRAIKELDMEFIPIDQSLIDTGYSMIKQGFVEDRINK